MKKVFRRVFISTTVGFALSQNLFTRDVLLAARTKNDVMTNIRQTTVSDKIDVAVNVSKAFYDVLLTGKQIEVLSDDILRLERNLKDAFNQYSGKKKLEDLGNQQLKLTE
jgi:outer membrane protein